MSALHSTSSPLALDFSFDIRRDDTHPRRVRARRRAPHDDSVKFLTLGHQPYRIRRRAACRQQYHLEVRPLPFPAYLPRRVRVPVPYRLRSAYKNPAYGFVKRPGNCGTIPSSFSVCVLDRPSDDLASLLNRSRLSDLRFLYSCSPSPLPSPPSLAPASASRHHHCLSLSQSPNAITIEARLASRRPSPLRRHLKTPASVDTNRPVSSLLPFPLYRAFSLTRDRGLSPSSSTLRTLLLSHHDLAPQTGDDATNGGVTDSDAKRRNHDISTSLLLLRLFQNLFVARDTTVGAPSLSISKRRGSFDFRGTIQKQ